MRAWINGRLLEDPTGPAISVVDHGVTVGDGVFEAIKIVDGEPFAVQRHLDRLVRSAAGLGLPEVDLDGVRAGMAAVLAQDRYPLGRLRITVTGGSGRSGPAVATTRRRWWSWRRRPTRSGRRRR